jgi:hypothetical protein
MFPPSEIDMAKTPRVYSDILGVRKIWPIGIQLLLSLTGSLGNQMDVIGARKVSNRYPAAHASDARAAPSHQWVQATAAGLDGRVGAYTPSPP